MEALSINVPAVAPLPLFVDFFVDIFEKSIYLSVVPSKYKILVGVNMKSFVLEFNVAIRCVNVPSKDVRMKSVCVVDAAPVLSFSRFGVA